MLQALNVSKSFGDTPVLRDVSVCVGAGEFACVVGRSGSGKSTLLNVLSSLLRPDQGRVLYREREVSAMGEGELNALRHGDFSMIFQLHHLLPYLTALENVMLPYMNSLRPVSGETRDKARECLARVGLAGKEERLPGKLSGGEQQRVAIARALVKSPSVLFADEPTGSLDKKNGDAVIELLRDVHRDGVAVVMVTHDLGYAKLADRTVVMEDGQVVEDGGPGC
ncbi:Lipoprotein-releasing system ATP-binding protein LolD [Fundidesulfovibrio magnetotacticus]|uniref:Cell division ATP-binding protein FtsE n=1 Tax=Fundidesulfovibrio magnetotacticus TaxID=2730080 RepID=A0A6V8M173_9BACT|nr:ABC transporter ATP-binding protein [Fundidesulfovibrio magnetotacticus]GFK95607.1 Lipoprotein-releasing system ATP-binding protein LolD [Fundidesulfovibrio magnetotacticus]